MRILHLAVPLLVALALAGIAHQLKQKPRQVTTFDCTAGEALCVLLGDVLRDVSGLQYDLQRQKFDKQTLPILHIYLSDGSLDKLYRKRSETLDKPGQILLVEDKDWVSASIIANDGGKTNKLKAKLRLKGDWADHIKHPTKLSFRIKVLKEGYAFGMKRFSIQQSATRNHQTELLLLEEMRRWGVIAPRYRFVDVRINDYRIGIMALEEHFSKELLEAQERREGPIVVINEDLIWRQKDLNARSADLPGAQAPGIENVHVTNLDLPVKQFRAPAYEPGTTATNNSGRAISMYRDYIDRLLTPEEVFDLEQLARWWVLINAWNGCHGAATHNRRFYFNPTTNLLEPIAFDNHPKPYNRTEKDANCHGASLAVPYLLGNADFQRYVLDFSETLLKSYKDAEWQEQFRQSQAALLDVLALESLSPPIIYIKDLLNNLSHFLNASDFNTDKSRRKTDDRPMGFGKKFPDAPIYSHIRAFLFSSDTGMTLKLKNLTADSLHNIRVTLVDNDGENILRKVPDTLPSFYRKTNQHLLTIDIEKQLTEDTQLVVDYEFRGKSFSETAIVQFANHSTGFSRDFLEVLSGRPNVSVDTSAKSITFGKGRHLLEQSLELDRDWSMTMKPGSQLLLTNGATLKIHGPLSLLGSETEPVTVDISPDADYRGVGAWGGILVSQSEQRSRIQHAILRGAGDRPLANRQDYYGITGCISFYESDVDIAFSEFTDMHCEDALNIVRSDFSISQTTIRTARADGFDSDFSRGILHDSLFEQTGNDAVDVSGTELTLKSVNFQDIGDKAVSVGEASALQASDLNINGSATGVASKDLSTAQVTDSFFSNIPGSGLITYIKKSEYGGASIECQRCTFNAIRSIATNQEGSQILIDGVVQPVTNFNQSQLVEAGFATE